MKNLKSSMLRKGYTLLVVLFVIVLASCNSNGQKTENEAPKGTIHEAVFMGNINQLKAHIAANTDLNQKDAYGSTPLSVAITFDKPEAAKLLIEAGADINATSGDGSTPLHIAAFYCRTEVVKLLLEKGADINVRNNYGATALESISGPFSQVKAIYDQISKDLGPLGLKLDYKHLETERPVIASMIQAVK